jgi:hypothetical protein
LNAVISSGTLFTSVCYSSENKRQILRENDVSYHFVIPNSRSRCLLRTSNKKIIQNFRHGCGNDKIELNKQDVRNEICSEDREESYVFRLMTRLSKSISSTKFLSKHFVDKLSSTSISSTEHFVDSTFRRQIFVDKHFVDRTFRRQYISSTVHFVDKFSSTNFCRQNILVV